MSVLQHFAVLGNKRGWLACGVASIISGVGSNITGCESDASISSWETPPLAQMDPQTCATCHPNHVQEWQGSMHAYAGDDPVFRALVARGIRETNGGLGGLCVGCHAPVAARLGATVDGSNLSELPSWLRGVTCYACHSAPSVFQLHNNGLDIGKSEALLGALTDPAPAVVAGASKPVHESAYSPLHDGRVPNSSELCGSCHDVVNGHGVALERTFQEWKASVFGHPQTGVSCASCHLPADDLPVATSPGSPARLRARHDHRMAGVDVLVTPFPTAEAAPGLMAAQAQASEAMRKNALCTSLCVRPNGDGNSTISVWLHNEAAGHNWPSGVAVDRRAWLDLQAFSGGLDIFSTGHIAADQAIASQVGIDPNLWLLRDHYFAQDGKPTHFSWDALSVVSGTLPTNDPMTLADAERTTWREKTFIVPSESIEKVEMVMKLRPIGLDLLDELIASGDLDPSFRATSPVFDVAPSRLHWPTGPAAFESDTGYGQCVSTAETCKSPFLCTTPFGCFATPTNTSVR